MALLYRYYPLTLENTLAHFWLLLLQLFLFLSLFLLLEIIYFFMDVNSYVGKKADLTWLDRKFVIVGLLLINFNVVWLIWSFQSWFSSIPTPRYFIDLDKCNCVVQSLNFTFGSKTLYLALKSTTYVLQHSKLCYLY